MTPEVPVVVPPVVEAPVVVDVAAMQKELADLRAANGEQTRATQYWFDKAAEKAAPVAVPADPAADNTDVLDVITAKGMAGLDELLDKHAAKRGFVRAEDVEAKIGARVSQVTAETRLVKQYPDLAQDGSDGGPPSEFFTAVAAAYGPLVKGGMSIAMASKVAAEQIELKWLREGKLETAPAKAAKAAQQKEDDRKARIAAQSGDRGHRAPDSAEDDELTPEQRRIAIAVIKDDGMTDEQAIEAYKKRSKAGVSMRGTPGGGR